MRYLNIGILACLVLVGGCFGSSASKDTCTQGTRGCPCLSGELRCLDASLTCNGQNVCADQACTPGQSGCSCRVQGTACDNSLECRGNLCQIPAGQNGGACLANGQCQPGLACSSGVCISCQQGERHCACLDGGSCHAGLACVRSTCVTEASEALSAPTNPTCYTPCSADITASDGAFTRCPDSGLLPGCLSGRTCQDGSCILGGGSALTCASDADCPDFQACFGGKCMADCERTSDCGQGLECYRKVCRIPCQADADTCPTGQSCVTTDGQNGTCGPLVASETTPKTEVVGGFALDQLRLEFSNMVTRRTLTVVNNGPAAIDVAIKVKDERLINENGIVQYVTTGALPWLRFGASGSCGEVNDGGVFHFTIDAGASTSVEVCHAATAERSRWEGTLAITNPDLGAQSVDVSYAERPDGLWTGRAYYFANFGESGLDGWIAGGRQDRPAVDVVKNAFVRRWAEFKFGRLTLDEFRAVMQATETESWRWPSVQALCATKNPSGNCYLYNNTDGFSTYTTSADSFPVPSGIVELPFAMNIHQTSGPGPGDTNCNTPAVFEGRIESDQALQYAGNPAVTLQLQGLPPACGTTPFGTSVVNVTGFESEAHLGGRYLSSLSDTYCRQTGSTGRFKQYRTPWLVPGFVANTGVDPTTQARYLYDCRDRLLPFGDSDEDFNLSMAAANPIPDGRARHRSLTLVDGALVDSQTLVVLFRETSDSFFATGESFSAYGYMVLQRKAADLAAADFVGSQPAYNDTNQSQLGVSCSQDLIDRVLGAGAAIDTSNASTMVEALLRGPQGGQAVAIDASSPEHVHYLCIAPDQTSTFGGLASDAQARQCPANSTVIYFTMQGVSDSEVATHTCNVKGTCSQVLQNWAQNSYGKIRLDPFWQCADSTLSYCDTNRRDLRADKTFFEVTPTPALLPLQTQVDQAFAYKMRFVSREGLNTGFTPAICSQSGSEIPYCYDPPTIEAIGERVDCALALYSAADAYGLPTPTQNRLRNYFAQNFAYEAHENLADGTLVKSEGFDYLNAELLIMLGDEAYVSALASRFDLAGAAVYGFAGSAFEPQGVNLSGVAGYEMFRLYQAGQYYQRVLDRFFALSPSFTQPGGRSFVTSATVTTYFSRLIRASTQKAKTWSEVAERYHDINHPDLAKLVIARAYTATYMESAILSGIMRQVLDNALPEDKAQIVSTIDDAERSYRDALLNMQTVNDKVSAELNFLGFAADYIPFPALDATDTNAFDKLRASATQKLQLAIARENDALASNRQYETDSASFQSELTRIRNEYENQLATICGTFRGSDGQVYPAVSKYAQLSADTAVLGDPCGHMGNGALYETSVSIVTTRLDVAEVRQQFDNTVAEIDSEKQRVAAQCGLVGQEVDFLIKQDQKTNSIQDVIDITRTVIDDLRTKQQVVAAFGATLGSCTPTVSTGVAGASFNAGACAGAVLSLEATAMAGAATAADEQSIRASEQKLRDLQQATMVWQVQNKCDEATVDSQARVRSYALHLAELQISAFKTGYGVLTAQAKYQELQNQAKRLVAQQTDAEQMAINVEAARNDPNVRIYKNDAILAADRTFDDALAEAYRVTKVYEYYTSQSYGKLGDLYIVRMAEHGEPSLEAYLSELFKAFDEFEEQYGNPDVRVAVISMRDDVLQIPRLDETGQALSHTDRVRLFRQKLGDVRLLDERGYLVAPFSTRLDLVSPLTRDHKVEYIEAEIEGANVGDDLGRIYLTQSGTGVVRSVSDTSLFYALPERTAVIDVSFNGHKVFAPEVYKNDRLRDRPLLNTHWSLAFNQKDESVNQDIDLSSITDIRLYVYYTDFTAF